MALAAMALLGACPESESNPDKQAVPGLVQRRERPHDRPVDVDLAARDVAELLRALSMPHDLYSAKLGSHRVRGTSTVTVSEGDTQLEALTVTTELDYAGEESFRALQDNSHDYGREAIYIGGYLYLRPRYSRYHRRLPETPREPAHVRTEMLAELAAYTELLATGVALADQGQADYEGRKVRKLALSLADNLRPPAAEAHEQRKWRERVVVTNVRGEILLDSETGAPLKGSLQGTAQVAREGKTLTLAVTVEHAVSGIGQPVAITVPADDQWVATPTRSHEVDERNMLLRGLAPPVRRSGGSQGPETSRQPQAKPQAQGQEQAKPQAQGQDEGQGQEQGQGQGSQGSGGSTQ